MLVLSLMNSAAMTAWAFCQKIFLKLKFFALFAIVMYGLCIYCEADTYIVYIYIVCIYVYNVYIYIVYIYCIYCVYIVRQIHIFPIF